MLFLFSFACVLLSTEAQIASSNNAGYFGGIDNQVYLDWIDENESGIPYDESVYMPSSNPENGSAVHWKIENEDLFLAVAVKATGWAAFGIAEAGGMLGADIVYYTAATNELTDSYVLDERAPIVDDCQDWILLNSQVDGGFIIFEAQRRINTNDTLDRPIINDQSIIVPAHRVISAWGDSSEIGYHGPNRARGSIRFFGRGIDESVVFETAMNAEADGFIDLRASDYLIRPIETEYAYFCFSLADLVGQGMPSNQRLHVIGFEPILDDDSVPFVHHFIVNGDPAANIFGGCNVGTELAYVWAPGEPPLKLPSNVGGPLGLEGFNSFELEIHYNNPERIQGVRDSSGVRLYYTSALREHDIGILQLGDSSVGLYGRRVGRNQGPGFFEHSFVCPSECSSVAVAEPVTVVREYLHMHATGVRAVNQQIRNGEVVREGAVDFWEFDQQGNAPVQQDAFQILPGDGFRTACFYDTAPDSNIRFGLQSSEEMCIAFLFYYPRQTLGDSSLPFTCAYELGFASCDAEWTRTPLEDKSQLGRTFGAGGGQCMELPNPLSNHSVAATPTVMPTAEPSPATPYSAAPSLAGTPWFWKTAFAILFFISV